MSLLKSYTYTWWQIGIFKLALLTIGAAIGAYWHSYFGAHSSVLIVIGVICALYVGYISLKR